MFHITNQRVTQLKRSHPDFTSEQYGKMAHKQGNRCVICGRWERLNTKRYLSIDHNHKTGKVRGLLCHYCNTVLGFVNDDIKILQNTIKYLKKK